MIMRSVLCSRLIVLALVAIPPPCVADETLTIALPGKASILRLGAVPTPVTRTGREMAQRLYDGLGNHDAALVESALEQIEPEMDTTNIGGTYSAIDLLAKAWLKSQRGDSAPTRFADPLDQAFYDYFLSNDAKNLKEYLLRKYGVANFQPKDPAKHLDRAKYLEDYLMFNNPARDRWEVTGRVLDIVKGLRPEVHRVIDVGAGFGYFSERFASALGKGAIVYAIDTEKPYVDELKHIVQRYHIDGVEPIVSTPTDVSVKSETDMAFMASLYHVLYGWDQAQERDAFMTSLRKSLRDRGYLVILDNSESRGRSLHNSFIRKEFAIAQLYFYGFELVKSLQLSPLRYILVLRQVPAGEAQAPKFDTASGQATIGVSDSRSVIHIGSLDSFDITPSGTAAAKLLMQAVQKNDKQSAKAAAAMYRKIIPTENFGGEYTALQWIAEYIYSPEDVRKGMTTDPLSEKFVEYLSTKDYARLKQYLARKYKLTSPVVTVKEAMDEKTRELGIVRRHALEDFILFNNPRRESWEKTSRILDFVDLKAGQTVVDVGSGPGYFTFKFAKIVGPKGLVYAVDVNPTHTDYVKELAKEWKLSQIQTVESTQSGFELPKEGQADTIFMCSLYHILYGVSSQSERDGMIKSITKALKPNGRLVVVDNGPVSDSKLPYHGPYIRKELIQGQLAAYGYKFRWAKQIIPQRYMMVFSR
jgi:predicted methyltransferase